VEHYKASSTRGTPSLPMARQCCFCNQSPSFLRCSICKNAYYCGAACQNKGWKKHKKICSASLASNTSTESQAAAESNAAELNNVLARLQENSHDNVRIVVIDAAERRDWRTVLKWKSRVNDILQGQSPADQERILHCYQFAFCQRESATGMVKDQDFIASLMVQRSRILRDMSHFLDQAKCICRQAEQSYIDEDFAKAFWLFKEAGKVTEENGFISIESRVCVGLGKLASIGINVRPKPWFVDNASGQSLTAQVYQSCHSSASARHEAILLFRNGVRAARLTEASCQQPVLELHALYELTLVLFEYNGGCTCDGCMSSAEERLTDPIKEITAVVGCYMKWITKMKTAQDQNGWVAREGRYDKHIFLEDTLLHDRVLASRERIDCSTPSLIMTRLHLFHIRAQLAVKMGLPDKAFIWLINLLSLVSLVQATRHMTHEFYDVLLTVGTPFCLPSCLFVVLA